MNPKIGNDEFGVVVAPLPPFAEYFGFKVIQDL
jgi:hypothetical protein